MECFEDRASEGNGVNFRLFREIVLIEPINESGAELMLNSRTATLKLKNAPIFHAIRWETETQ
jgi:hypothetical protein